MSQSPTQALAAEQSILGYTLKERIGAGGYGEVWSAEAPGGMLKAVKFVYGFHDENRAQRELKALDRVKEARHPFLLSLERIDVVDGRLVVITELADKCLKDRFNQCREDGLEGIPREELLAYIRESADALDYLAETYALAHLDVKPENLLLVGQHAKVADFGLVKDIHNVNQSLMDGLTPAYAAPELFDGQPSRASDQYSLAIVYQEMLTSTRPFSGTTSAQLASQHIHSRPNLNSLPRSDQAVIARALSKEPDKRYVDCRSMVDELTKRRSRIKTRKAAGPRTKSERINTSGQTNAEFDIKAVKHDQTMTISESFIPAVKFEASLEKLEPFDLKGVEPTLRPTLFIGVGQTGTQTLCLLRRRLSHQYGTPEQMPAIRFLSLDVDRRSLFDATLGNESEALRSHEIVNLPLRKPEEYRNDPDLDVSWIGRRWIYNVPKSQLTESLRPLGRLAYVDHHEKIYQKIHDELEKLTAAESLAATSETTGLCPADVQPQIIVVSSISGGVGSGMVLDLAYSIRVCMGELGLSDDHLYGMLLHSTSRATGDYRLDIANTYAFLNEYYHYNLNGFPGSDYCAIPAFDDQTPAFNQAYVVHLGDDLKESDYQTAIDGVAEYLCLSTVSRCNGFFELCRHDDEYDPNSLRSVGINFISRGKGSLTDRPAHTLALRLLNKWLKGDPKSGEPSSSNNGHVSSKMADELINRSGVHEDRLTAKVDELIREELGDSPATQLLRLIHPKINDLLSNLDMDAMNLATKLLNARLGSPNENALKIPGGEPTVCEIIDAKIPIMARRIRDELAGPVFALIDDPQARVFGTKEVADALFENLQVLAVTLEPKKAEIEAKLKRCGAQYRELITSKNNERDAALELVAEYVNARVQLIRESYKRRLVSAVRNELAVALGSITEFSQKLDLVNQQLNFALNVRTESSNPLEEDYGEKEKDLREIMVQQVIDKTESLLPLLETQLEERHFAGNGGLLTILRDGGHRMRQLPELIRGEAHNIVCQAMKELRIDTLLRDSNFSAPEIANWLNSLVEAARPNVLECGGATRLMLAVPEEAPVTAIAGFIQNQFDHEANVIAATCGDLVVCYEMAAIPIENVAMSIMQMQPDCAELVGRLHCRNDIEWTSLTPLC